MKAETINSQNRDNCAAKMQTVARGMESNPESSAANATFPQGNDHPHRPKRRSDVSMRHIDGEVVVLDRQGGLIHQLNHTASYIWDRCDGQLTVAEIADQLTLTFDVQTSTAAKDVAAIIRQFHSLRLLETC